MQSDFRHIAEDIRRQIDESLSSVGILFRVFARGKSSESIEHKINSTPGKYSHGGKLIQDIIGVRVALYFLEDIPIVENLLKSKYSIDEISSQIDKHDSNHFSVTRHNLVFKLPVDSADNFRRIAGERPLDITFEVQLRSVLSEGWHEVEHDLRYKNKDHWQDHDDLSRALNGVVATLQTSEWCMGKIFDELSYRHYKNKNWAGMVSSLLKIRMKGSISKELIKALNDDSNIAKQILKVDRFFLIKSLSNSKPRIPITIDNIIYFWNATGPKYNSLTALTPVLILETVDSMSQYK